MRDDTNRPCQSRFDQWSENQLSIATAVGAKLEASSNSQPSLQDCFQCNDIRNLIAWLRDHTWQLADAVNQSSQCCLGPESITPMSASSGRDRCCCAPERSG